MNIILALYSISITIFNILLLILNVEFKEICLFNLSYSIYFITITLMKIAEFIINFKLNITIDNNIYYENDKDVKMN